MMTETFLQRFLWNKNKNKKYILEKKRKANSKATCYCCLEVLLVSNGWWGRTAWFPEWLLLLSPFCLCFNVFLWTVRRSVWKIVSSPVPAVLAPKGKALHRLRASGGPPALTRASRTARAKCPRAGASETAAEPGKRSASRERRRGRTRKVRAWSAVLEPWFPAGPHNLSLST